MASTILSMDPGVQIDLIIPKYAWSTMVSYFTRTGCQYQHETTYVDPETKREQVKFIDISGKSGKDLYTLIGLFYGLEWNSLFEEESRNPGKFYIIIHQKRRKPYVQQHRTAVHSGSEGGN